MHSTEKVHDTTLEDENASQHMSCIVVTALGNQPEAFASDLGDDQSRYLAPCGLRDCKNRAQSVS